MDTSVDADRKKKAYEKPQLEVYGNLGDITQKIGCTGTFDGGATGTGHGHTR